MDKTLKTYEARQLDALAVGDPVWILDTPFIEQAIVTDVSEHLRLGEDDPAVAQTPLGYYVQELDARTPPRFQPRVVLFRRPTELEELVAQARTNLELLEQAIEDLEETEVLP